MQSVLLQTKITIPVHRNSLILRRNLLARMDQLWEPGYRLALISAPAGYGKTTLVSDWLHGQIENGTATTLAWLTLEETENDPVRFLRYLIASLQSTSASLGGSADSLLEGFLRTDIPLETVLLALINDLNAHPGLILLTLDDMHTIHNPEVHRLLGFLVDHQPDNLRLLMTTRTDPALPLPRLRARRQIIELRTTNLRFSEDEALMFLSESMNISLNPDQLAVLMRRTEGWVAGLQLAGAALQLVSSQQDSAVVSEFINSMDGSDRYILEYLLDEVFRYQPEPVQQFLLSSCILQHLSVELCNAVLDRSDSAAMLDSLEHANLFILPLNAARSWFRYHPLFREFLQARHPLNIDRHLLHARAMDWYENHGQIDAALEHALLAEDFERLACLVESSRRQMLIPGEARRFLRYLEVLPLKIRSARPLLLLSQAWADLLAGRVSQIETQIQAAYHQNDSQAVNVLGEIAALRSLAAVLTGDFSRAADEASQALTYLPADDYFLRAWLNLNLGMASDVIGDMDRAGRALQDALSSGRASKNHVIITLALNELGDLRYRQGNLHLAGDMYRQSIDSATFEGRVTPAAAIPCSRLGRLYYEWNQLEQARELLLQAIELGRLWEGTDIYLYSQAYLAHVCQSQSDQDCAKEHVKAVEKAIEGTIISTPTLRVTRALLARLALRQANDPEVQAWEQQIPDSLPDTPSIILDIEECTRARALLANKNASQALTCLEPLICLAEKEERFGSLVELLALKALAFAGLEQFGEARDTVRRALELGENGGFLRTFADEGPPMLTLIENSLPHKSITLAYQNSLRQVFGQETRLITSGAVQTNDLSEPVSQREVEVLRLISQGFSNQEIARQMVISISTVKTHINNLFGKMGVKSRTEAVARAREIKLLD